jgi:prepilin signal peptidase PulO-like enzyme (type II secretory pathway)
MLILFAVCLIVFALVDIRLQRIPLEPILILLATGLFWQAANGTALNALCGMAIGLGFFGLQFLVSKGRWIGDGDIWLAGAMGAWLGWWGMLIALYAAYMGGGLIALVLLVSGVWKRGQRVPFAPFLALGGIVAIAVRYWGK